MIKKLAYVATAFSLPLFAAAATINNLGDVGSTIINIINQILVPVIFAVAFIVFIWGAFSTFILGASDEEARSNGKNLMIYSLIGFFVMICIWGLVNIVTGTFATNNALPTTPSATFNGHN